jgi:hypothetical protein
VHFDELDERERAWVRENEALWRQAHAIVARHAAAQPTAGGLDVSLVYHTLVNFRRTPEQRLERGLVRRADAGR